MLFNYQKILILLFGFITFGFSQEAKDTLDQLKPKMPIELILHLDDSDFYLDLQNLNKAILMNENSNTKWLWAKYSISKMEGNTDYPGVMFSSITQPLFNNYIKSIKFNPVRYALGLMQAGAAGYLAYKHLKKYGF